MTTNRRDLWTQIQRAETLLIQASARANPDLRGCIRHVLEQYDLSREARGLMIRVLSGFDVNDLRPTNYLKRYPFSSERALVILFDELVEGGILTREEGGQYAVTERGREVISGYHACMKTIMHAIDVPTVSDDEIQTMLAADRQIVAGLVKADRPHGSPLLKQRLNGLQPDYDPPEKWHHWQYVWTMLVATEDEQEYRRQEIELDPLAWFIRRQLWLNQRRPWQSRPTTVDSLITRARSYAPLDEAEAKVKQALDDLHNRGWVTMEGDIIHLTEQGLQAADDDEALTDSRFLEAWPDWSEQEAAILLDIVTRLNDYLNPIFEANTPS